VRIDQKIAYDNASYRKPTAKPPGKPGLSNGCRVLSAYAGRLNSLVARNIRVSTFKSCNNGIITRKKQNLTISISSQIVPKAKILAARRSTSISGLLAEQVELLVGTEEAYERSERSALGLLEEGFHLGGITAGRDELHER